MIELHKGMFAYELLPNDFKYNPPVTRWDPKTNRTLVGRPSKGFGSVPEFYYAGKTLRNDPWEASPQINSIRLNLEKHFRCSFHHVLVALYPDGNTAIDWHTDEMVEPNDLIVNVSLGSPRTFQLRFNDSPEQIQSYRMEHGDVLIIDGVVNAKSTHTVPAEPEVTDPRVSLTFRTIGRKSGDQHAHNN
jgi:alkylated DNA repair dioxygenase AlkB